MTSTPFVSISLGPTHANARLGTQEMGKLAVVSNRYNIYISKVVYLKFPISLRETRWLFLRMVEEFNRTLNFSKFAHSTLLPG